MLDQSIKNLHAALDHHFGARVHSYGSSREEEHGYGFTIDGIQATFSAITFNGTLPLNRFDIQIESLPPGDYIYTDELSLDELLNLMDRFAGPIDHSPSSRPWERKAE